MDHICWEGIMPKIQSWEVSDAFWEKVSSLVPAPERDPNKAYRRKPGGGKKPMKNRQIFEAIMYDIIDKALLFDDRSIKQDRFVCQGKTGHKMQQNMV
jgi:hypothetical protein